MRQIPQVSMLAPKRNETSVYCMLLPCPRRYDSNTGNSVHNPRQPLNMQSGFLDASTVYGPNEDRLSYLRTFSGGLLHADPINGCPRNSMGAPMAGHFGNAAKQRVTGDDRGNMNPGLLVIHCLFVLEHNRWARELATRHPSWTDTKLFQEARKRVRAIVQSITFNEYAPLLLGEPLPEYRGYDQAADPAVDLSFAIAAYRYGHSGINQVYWCVKPDGSNCEQGHLLLRDVYFSPALVARASN